MSGNIAEWVADWYAADAYQHHTGPDPGGPSTGTMRVRRGGSWGSLTMAERGRGDLLAYFRDSYTPGFYAPNFGFRCARTVLPAHRGRSQR